MKDLKKKHCVPCEGKEKPMSGSEIKEYMNHVSAEWKAVDNKKIQRKFSLKDFKGSMSFIQLVAPIAEEQDHHPDIHIYYKDVVIELTTHAIGGLSENDFIMAAKIDELNTSDI